MDAFQTMKVRRSTREYSIASVPEETGNSILDIPLDVRVIALTPLGYHDEVSEPSGRKHLATTMNDRR